MSVSSGQSAESIYKLRYAEICNSSKVFMYANFTKEEYYALIDEVKCAEQKKETKTKREYYLLSK